MRLTSTSESLNNFHTKNALLLASYELICQRTNERIATSTAGKRGFAALSSLCVEIIPAENLTTVEANVVVSLRQRDQGDEVLCKVGRDALAHRDAAITACLAQLQNDGRGEGPADPDLITDELLNTMMGLQITAMLDPQAMSGSRQRRLIESMLNRLAGARQASPAR